MDYVPYEFVKDVITQVDSLRPFLELSGQWREVAEQRREEPVTSLIFQKSDDFSDIQFAFGDNDAWEALKNNRPVKYFIEEVHFVLEEEEDLTHYPLDYENAFLLEGYLKKNTYPVALYLRNSRYFSATTMKPLLHSIPRVSQLSGDCYCCDRSLFFEFFKKAVQRGTLEGYNVIRYQDVPEDYTKTIEEFVLSNRINYLSHVLPEHEDVTFLMLVLEAWIAKENCDTKYTLAVGPSLFHLVRHVMTKRGFEDRGDKETEGVVYQKEARKLRLQPGHEHFLSLRK
uniref:F-box domain-containing protein n=1 Tax=Steinernema glaseri TaxID=37863 RepID=A0A1I7ZSL2_9BILA